VGLHCGARLVSINDFDTNFFIIGGLVGETGFGNLSGVGPKPDAEVTKARGVILAGALPDADLVAPGSSRMPPTR